MKTRLFLFAFLILCGAAANEVPNSSFEQEVFPLWNRMPDESVMLDNVVKYDYSSDCASGKRSLHLKGQKVELAYESMTNLKSATAFALKMKAPKGAAKVTVKCLFYLNTERSIWVEKSFNVTKKWQSYVMKVGNPFSRYRRGGNHVGPTRFVIDPGKGEVLVDDCLIFEGKRAPKTVASGPVGGVPEKEVVIPEYIPLPAPESFGKGACAASTWEFRLFPGKGGAEKNASVSGVMLFPKSKVFYNSGSFALFDGKKKLNANFYPIAAWPGDKSLAALKAEAAVDTAAKAKTLILKFTPGGKKVEKSAVPAKSGVITLGSTIKVDLASSNLWEENGKLKKALLKGVDYAGVEYTFKSTFAAFEHGTLLRRGKLVSAGGLSLGMADVRLTPRKDGTGAELDIAVSNTSKKFIPLRTLYWEAQAPAGKETLKRTIWGDHRKSEFIEKVSLSGKEQIKKYTCTFDKLPQFSVKGENGVFLHVYNGAQTFPNELEIGKDFVKGALWPASAKALSLAPGLTLRKRFIAASAPLSGTPDQGATLMAAARHFADSKVLISMCAADPGKLPFFEERMKSGMGRLSFTELHNRFCYGQFNYGDHPGDGGWGNLESFEDYVLYHRAVRAENPELFRLAKSASLHYADIDTDSRNALPYTHSANHIIGGNSFGHAWIPGVLSSWLLTGDPAIYQSARRMFDGCIKLPLNFPEIQQGRHFGFFLLTLAEGYAVFNDSKAVKRFMEQLNYQIKRYADTPPTPEEQRLQRTSIPRQNSLFYVTGSGLVPFHCWYGLTGFLKMYELTGNELIKKTLEKELANILNLEMTYRPQIETHWPGMPAEKLFPTIATDYLYGRGAFFYPVLAMYARLSGKKEYIDLALDTLYCGLLATRNAGNIQDVFMAAPLADAPKDFDEAKQIEKVRKLLWEGAAPELANGDFSTALSFRDLVIPKKGIGTPRYPEWALDKPYPRWWHLVEGKQVISSMFMTYRGYFYTLDYKEFGKSAPALRLDMTTRRYWSAGDLSSAKFRMEPGEWEVAFSFKTPKDASITLMGVRVMGFGKFSTLAAVEMTPDFKVFKSSKNDGRLKVYAMNCKDTEKTGWKRLSYRFRLDEKALGYFHMRHGMHPKAKEAHIYLDDVEIRRVGK